ncbi:hypothetical protein B4U80_01541 [Leptotrombidium deliense]|uniref:Uncharacterized protein n=1 Tax=Leptotrombidium deliense TaxID=299467 RepID=A0A443SQY5_9ACAR|nr:hypothetical protein B4U80_01541 [Leptotrombidium deliense]
MPHILQVLSKFYEEYSVSTPKRLKIIDAYLFYILVTGVVEFVYCCLVGTFPFNSFLSGFISTVACFVLAVCLRLQVNQQNKSEFASVSNERAFADFLFAHLSKKCKTWVSIDDERWQCCFAHLRLCDSFATILMDFIRFLTSREIFPHKAKHSFQFLMQKYKLSQSCIFNDLEDISPLSIALNSQLIAVVTEFGNVCLFEREGMKKVNIWQGHNNAIFDTKWRLGFSNELLTASGDQNKQLLKVESAHKSSIKSVSFGNEYLVASGARDGIIKIWDIRCEGETRFSGHQLEIPDAHENLKHLTHRRSRCPKQRSDPLNSVTCVLFQKYTNYLYSSGANDAAIKLWDLRKLGMKGNVTPSRIFPYLGTTSYTDAHGFTSLALDSQNRLFANCSDHNVYCYFSNDETSAIKFVGQHNTNNFTKIKVVSDKYLVRGSTDGNAYLWSLSSLSHHDVSSSYTLPHGTTELTAVDCVDVDLSIYTCGEDQTLKEWRIGALNTCDYKPISELEAQPFSHDDVEVVNVVPTKRSLNSPSSSPLSLITNWVQVKRSDSSTPTNSKITTKAKTTPRKRISKENNLRSKRRLASKKLLFQQNKKISDYFT